MKFEKEKKVKDLFISKILKYIENKIVDRVPDLVRAGIISDKGGFIETNKKV